MLAAVSGIDANQNWMDVIGNNIANDNTTGFKQDDVVFDALLSQQEEGASAPTVGQAGQDATDIGTGTSLGAVSPNFAEGTLEQTGNPDDVAINGDGFLIADSGGQQYFTRDGNLTVDADGNLATTSGALIQGWQAVNGVLTTTGPTGGIVIPIGTEVAPVQTTSLTAGGNLNAGDAAGTVVTQTATVYDELGNAVPLTLTYTKAALPAVDTWTLTGSATNAVGASPTALFGAGVSVVFNPNGTIDTVGGVPVPAGGLPQPIAALTAAQGFPNAVSLEFDAATSSGALTQFAQTDAPNISDVNGNAAGTLAGFSIGSDGIITGNYTNGVSQSLGQIALASFSNPQGLTLTANNLYQLTPNAGNPDVGVAGAGGRGTFTGGALESSNVDLGSQLTNLIIAQTSYQANTKVVSTSDQALQSLVNMT
jgi:flagellar hook protein FlgE